MEDYREMVEQAPILIWRSDVTGKCNYLNRRWLDFVGPTVIQQCGDVWVESMHADDLKRCLAIYQRAFARREPCQIEYRIRRHDGVYRWMFYRVVPFKNQAGEFAGYIGSGMDVTERVEGQEALYHIQLAEQKKMQELVPICAHCKNIRDDKGGWTRLETYLHERAELQFTHALCPICSAKLYPEDNLFTDGEKNTHIGK